MQFSINANSQGEYYSKHWQFCVGSCHAPLAHRVDYLKQLKFIHDELGMERVRFHGLFNDDMNVVMSLHNCVPLNSAKKYTEYSFYQIGLIYDNILSTGMKPFVELGFMPEVLAKGKRKCSFSYKGNVSMPKRLDDWADFIRQFIEFLIDRYGVEEVSSWYFEVWNEPNLGVFFSGSMKDYFELYRATATAIKGVNCNIKVGGPSTAGCAWTNEFVEYCKSNGVPYDFISTHQYPGESLGHSLSIGKIFKEIVARAKTLRKRGGGNLLDGARIMFVDKSDTEQIDGNLFRDNALVLKQQIGETPLLFTEWNVTSTCTAPINDSKLTASYIAKIAMQLGGIAEATSFWSFSDIFEELQFFPTPFSGSFGLLTIHGIPKPSFYAFKLLSMLGDTRLEIANATNENTSISCFRKGNKLQILLFNQTFDRKDKTKEIVSINIKQLTANKKATIYRIDDEHCNPYSHWENMGSPKYLSKQQVEKIIQASSLKQENIDIFSDDDGIFIETTLFAGDTQLIEVEI